MIIINVFSPQILLGGEKVVVEGVLVPEDALLLVGLAVGVPVLGPAGTPEEPPQIRALLVATASFSDVALPAAGTPHSQSSPN